MARVEALELTSALPAIFEQPFQRVASNGAYDVGRERIV